MGAGVKIGANASIEYAEIGEGTRISPFASIGGEPQDLGYKGELTKVIIGKNCWIREFATVNRASGEGGVTKNWQQMFNYGICTCCTQLRFRR